MYAYIKGTVTEISPKNIILENNYIGYDILVPNPYEYTISEEVTIFISQQIREDSNTLYGFKTKEQKEVFLLLLKVKGVGPKSALAILAGAKSDEIIEAIDKSDVNYMTKFPGIGKKSAQQIILDLKGKIDFINDNNFNTNKNQELIDAILALEALGYNKKELSKIEKQLSLYEYKTADEFVKQGLKLLISVK
ncbi:MULTISPECIES: Holliday junction branch migration protein RuvA [unclassified Gemella]|uniref:Holliday junction branch migration protein RuvA n=1 Tax=unclassified Gemella TaxID=2624949 RepID=UPI001C0589D8|nr:MULTISPECIES: Holliday junction branch migration protein RuvA [unclassified Gemella]MBU0278475.1 Holliday junction branch migration protein RuvA [Gemella sp. zg-1178]QWQ39483.1 Holliday junction branch migration protein RuvA [Gemella sp. zg-570]